MSSIIVIGGFKIKVFFWLGVGKGGSGGEGRKRFKLFILITNYCALPTFYASLSKVKAPQQRKSSFLFDAKKKLFFI